MSLRESGTENTSLRRRNLGAWVGVGIIGGVLAGSMYAACAPGQHADPRAPDEGAAGVPQAAGPTQSRTVTR